MVDARSIAVGASVIVAVFAAISGYYLSLPQLSEGIESQCLTRAFAGCFLFLGDLVSIFISLVYVSFGWSLYVDEQWLLCMRSQIQAALDLVSGSFSKCSAF